MNATSPPILIVNALLAVLCGCKTDQANYDGERLPADQEVLLDVPGVTNAGMGGFSAGNGVIVKQVDGKPGPQAGAFGESRYGTVRLRPGKHVVVVGYHGTNGRQLYSDHDVGIRFDAKPGHTYRVEGWPPKVYDRTPGPADGKLPEQESFEATS
jgi:hypothetical protein